MARRSRCQRFPLSRFSIASHIGQPKIAKGQPKTVPKGWRAIARAATRARTGRSRPPARTSPRSPHDGSAAAGQRHRAIEGQLSRRSAPQPADPALEDCLGAAAELVRCTLVVGAVGDLVADEPVRLGAASLGCGHRGKVQPRDLLEGCSHGRGRGGHARRRHVARSERVRDDQVGDVDDGDHRMLIVPVAVNEPRPPAAGSSLNRGVERATLDEAQGSAQGSLTSTSCGARFASSGRFSAPTGAWSRSVRRSRAASTLPLLPRG